jgi:hypothetical protein
MRIHMKISEIHVSEHTLLRPAQTLEEGFVRARYPFSSRRSK